MPAQNHWLPKDRDPSAGEAAAKQKPQYIDVTQEDAR